MTITIHIEADDSGMTPVMDHIERFHDDRPYVDLLAGAIAKWLPPAATIKIKVSETELTYHPSQFTERSLS